LRAIAVAAECNILRRTLHRGFHDAIGMGPVAILRHRRLCSIHSALREGDPTGTTIAEIALQHGFLNLGRFSGYYRALFGEYPSETFSHSWLQQPPMKRSGTHRKPWWQPRHIQPRT
jgi:transcriptional regulator GlxA family with amidase domain